MAAEFGAPVDRNYDAGTGLIAEVTGTAVTGMLLVAFVDKKLHWHEHQTLVEYMRVAGPHVDAEKLLAYLDDTAHLLEAIPECQWPGLFEIGRNLPDELKVNILAMCTKLAFADGDLSPDESNLIYQIADWINIDHDGRKLWKEGVRGALEAAQLRGLKYTGIDNLDRPEEPNPKPDEQSFTIQKLARRAYMAGEMEKCVDLLQNAAADGDAQCQAFLGTLYQEGDARLDQDLVRAVKLFEQSASQYNLMGTFLLARSHYLGIGISKDEWQGIRLFRRAAFMNYPDAQAMLAQIYRELRNSAVGGAWLVVAASNGHSDAVRYIEEQGEPPDEVKQIASRLIEAIQGLKILVHMNPELALTRLAEMEDDDI